jgi:hypothetical protein
LNGLQKDDVFLLFQSEVSVNYLKATNFMFLGGLILALAIEHSGLHQRLALKIMIFVGSSPKFILLGFMITTGKFDWMGPISQTQKPAQLYFNGLWENIFKLWQYFKLYCVI